MQILVLAAALAGVSVPVILTPSRPDSHCRQVVQNAQGEKVGRCGDKNLTRIPGRAWLETDTQISRRSVDLTREVADSRVVLPWSYAGTAAAESSQFEGQEQIEWLAAGGMFRRYSRPRERVRLPEGAAIAIARRRGEIVAVSRPMTIQRGVAEEAQWEQPIDGFAQMVALLTWPPNERDSAERPASLTLVSETSHHPPDAVFDTDEWLLGIWYRATSGDQMLEVQSDVVYLPENQIHIRRGRLNVVKEELRPLPSLVLSAGDEAGDEWPELIGVIRDAATGAALRETPVRLGEQVVIEHLPPRQLQVILSVGNAWRFARPADLRQTEQGMVEFGLSPFRVAGQLIEADQPVKGTVSFRSDERWFAVQADERGRFEFDAWSAGRYIYEARAAGQDEKAPAYSSTIVLSASTPEITIRLPSERLRVRVTDADTDAPLKDAAVSLRNTWIDPAEGQRRFASRFAVDAKGEVTLPPIHVGEAELMVQAPGYVSDEQAIAIANGTDRLLRVALRREDTSAVRIALPNGAPAAGAEAVAFAQGAMAAWRGTTDNTGRLQIPNRFRGAFIVIRHREAASAAVLFDDVLLAREDIRLQAPATELHVKAEGENIANPAVVIWLNGVRLDGFTTAFAVWAPLPFVDHTGVWRARNLPTSDVRVLVTPPPNLERVRTGALDAVFTTVRFPWTGVVPVRITE
jgi:carboxypeptidase family protein